MKKKIALLMAAALLMVAVLGTGVASALGSSYGKTVVLQYYDFTNQSVPITDSNLPQTWSVTDGSPLSYTQITSSYYTIVGVMSGSPQYIFYNDSNYVMKLLVIRNANYTPAPTYYYGSGQDLSLGYGDYMYYSIQVSNPLPSIPVGTTYLLTASQLGSLQPGNSRLTFSTSNSSIATTSGPTILGVYPGSCMLYVYYNSQQIIAKPITVTGTTVTPVPVATPSYGLSIGPASFTSPKGKSYRFTGCVLDGDAISARSLKWYSSNPTIAVVSSAGVVYLRKAGTVTITAKTEDGEYSASVKFLVS